MFNSSLRLADLPVSAKVLLTAFLALIGTGYLVGLRNIYEHHHEADLEPGMTVDDLRRVYHGLDKEVSSEGRERFPSLMERMVRPGGPMRKYLERGGPQSTAVLTSWLEQGATEAEFGRPTAASPGGPSPQQVIAAQCIRCHNSKDGEMSDTPYADSAGAEPEYALVAGVATPRFGGSTMQTSTMHLPPTGRAELVQITHAHILAIPVFTLIVGGLFLLTCLPGKFKAIVAPIPMLLLCADFASWWLSRSY